MPIVEMFFDHTCPFCYKGHAILKEVWPSYPEIEIKWIPIEAHPRLEEPEHLPYEDLAVQGAYFVRDMNGDEQAYHERLYKAHFEEKVKVDDVNVLAACIDELGMDAIAFKEAVVSKKYEAEQLAANDYAYEKNDVWAVPTFVFGEKRLDAVLGEGITKEQLITLFEDITK